MSNQKMYQRQRVGKYIIKVLQDLGGTASKQKIKEEIVAAKKIKIKNDLVCKLSHFFTGFQNIGLKPRCFFAY